VRPRIEVIQIETTRHCTRQCPWCWNHGRTTTSDDLMPMDTFRAVLARIKATDYRGRIHPYVQEPLCDPRLVDLVGMIRAEFPTNHIFINTNGDLLNLGMAVDLFNAGLSEMQVNHYDARNEHLKQDLIGLPVSHVGLSELLPTMWNRAGKTKAVSYQGPPCLCISPFAKVTIMSNADVVICCCDVDHEVVLGNLIEHDFMDIWMSPIANKYRIAHRLGDFAALPLCKDCNLVNRKDSDEIRQRRAL